MRLGCLPCLCSRKAGAVTVMCSGLAKVVGAIRFQPDKEWAQGDEGRLLRAADCLLRGASRAAVVDSGLVPRDDSNAGLPCLSQRCQCVVADVQEILVPRWKRSLHLRIHEPPASPDSAQLAFLATQPLCRAPVALRKRTNVHSLVVACLVAGGWRWRRTLWRSSKRWACC